MPFGSTEFAWNSVDVRGDDGLLHHGRVIDAVPEGLVVQFGGTAKSTTKLVPFGLIYHCNGSETSFLLDIDVSDGERGKLTKERPVEVLLRTKPDVPWKWYPGTLLMGDYWLGEFGLVNVTLPGGAMRGIVEGDRIRARSTDASLGSVLVKKGTFSIKLVMVPREHSAFLMPDEELIRSFNAKMGCTTELCYDLLATHVVSSAHHGLFKQLAVLGIFEKPNRPRCFAIKDERNPGSDILLSGLSAGDVCLERIRSLFPEIPTPDGRINGLCVDILSEVVECLTPVQQTSLRGVCRLWEPILTSAKIGRMFLFSQPKWYHGSYDLAACMYNRFNQHTKMFVLHGERIEHVIDGRLAGTACLLERIMAERKVPVLQTVFVVDKVWSLGANSSDWLTVLHTDLISLMAVAAAVPVCHEVILENVIIDVDIYSSRRCTGHLIVLIDHQRINSHFTMSDLCAMLNDGLSDLGPRDMKRISEWIRHVSTSPTTDLWMVAEILNTTQTADPRNGVRYRGMKFYPYGTDRLDSVDARHLTNLTLHFLKQSFKKRGSRNLVTRV